MTTHIEKESFAPPRAERESPYSRNRLSEILDAHRDWLDSQGEAGARADFSGANLKGADLIDARLREAILNQTNLTRADLMLADLRGASLRQSNLQDANLLGTQFQEASLEGAVFTGATGMVSAQLAQANIFAVILPESVSPMAGLREVMQMARQAAWLLGILVALQFLALLRIFTMRDAQLIKNAPALPFLGMQTALPFVPFFLFGPLALLIVQVIFHVYLQRIWDGAAQAPAILQDGKTLDSCLPWFARWPALAHCKWLRKTRSPLAFLEAALSMLLLYWLTPITLLLFWGRYLTQQDLRGSTVHVLTVTGAVLAALNFPRMAAKAFVATTPSPSVPGRSLLRTVAFLHGGVPAILGFMLMLLSAGVIEGAPHDAVRPEDAGPARIRTWGTRTLWLAGYDPFPQLTETDVSTKPLAWSGRDEELAQVRGANLNRSSLRYMQGYGAFLSRARLWQADLQHAYLADADLREANLRQANLQFATLDGARLKRATLQQADLSNTSWNRSDLSGANLSSANLRESSLLDVALTGANLYQSNLAKSNLQRANLKQSDFREANLEESNLNSANLQDAYLSSAKLGRASLTGADLARANLIDADLRSADLRGAVLQGTILRGANLAGANLQGLDLREALGLTWAQVCPAANFTGAQMDESLRLDLQVQCGNHR